jgi:tRNA U34 2-thiouridine synthase MnmA/TrmU
MSTSRKNKKIRAVGLLSGGMDITLAAKLMLEQGIEVFAVM